MTDVFPQRNLPDQAEAWGREIEDRIKDIQKQVSVVSNTTRNTNLVAVKSAEAADHNVRQVVAQVESLEPVFDAKVREALDTAIEELREAETVLEGQFEAHDTAIAEAETAITEAQGELGALDGRITSAVDDLTSLVDAVQSTADGKSRLVRSASAASSPGDYAAGDQWWQYEGSQVVGLWMHDGVGWVSQTLTDAVLTNLDAGSITAGVLDAARIGAQSITAEKLVISPANVWPDPYFVETGAWPTSSGGMVTDPDMPGGTGLQIIAQAAGQRGTYYRGSSSRLVQVEPGAQYRFRATVKQEGGPDPSGLSVYIRGWTADGTVRLASKVIVPGDVEPGIFTVDEALPAIPGDVHGGVTVGIHTLVPHRDGKVFTVGGASLTRMADSSLIVDGGVLARHVEAESVAAAVGVFIDAMMQNLTVTGVANISTAVADQLYAKLAVVDKLQATSGIVTKDMIATGAITSEKIAANAVSAAMVDVGQNAKWDSTGLRFYAPPFPDQAWDDWENRTPIISLTPAGDVSVTVAQGGQPTAGMEATGLVHGDVGQFNSLTVGGQEVTGEMFTAPHGVISYHGVDNSVQYTKAETRLMTIPVLVMPGRMYEIEFQVHCHADSSVYGRIRRSATGVPTTSNTLRQEYLWQYGSGQKVFTFKHIISESLLTEEVPPEGLLVNHGLFMAGVSDVTFTYYGTSWGGVPRCWAIVRDIGVDLGTPDLQAPASTVVPKKDYSATASYRWWRGFAQDGRHSVDSRATVAGRLWGTDMHEQVIMGVSDMMSNTSGSSVQSASVTIRRSDSAGYTNAAWNIGFASSYNAPGTMPSVTWIATNQNFTFGQTRTFSVPSAHLDKLRTGAFRSIVVGPTHAASSSSYGIVDVAATKVAYKYRK